MQQHQQQQQKINTKTIITQMNTLAIIIINYFWARCVCVLFYLNGSSKTPHKWKNLKEKTKKRFEILWKKYDNTHTHLNKYLTKRKEVKTNTKSSFIRRSTICLMTFANTKEFPPWILLKWARKLFFFLSTLLSIYLFPLSLFVVLLLSCFLIIFTVLFVITIIIDIVIVIYFAFCSCFFSFDLKWGRWTQTYSVL